MNIETKSGLGAARTLIDPGTPAWQAWRSYHLATGDHSRVRAMDQAERDEDASWFERAAMPCGMALDRRCWPPVWVLVP